MKEEELARLNFDERKIRDEINSSEREFEHAQQENSKTLVKLEE